MKRVRKGGYPKGTPRKPQTEGGTLQIEERFSPETIQDRDYQ